MITMKTSKYLVAKFHWSKMVWILSIITTLLLIGASAYTLLISDDDGNVGKIIVMLCIIPLPAICFALSPRLLYLFGNALIIKRWIGRVTIPTEEITSVVEADKWLVLRSTRTMGNGGYFGYYGRYYNVHYGKFRMFASEMTNLYLIRTKRDNYVISCRNKELITELQNRIKS